MLMYTFDSNKKTYKNPVTTGKLKIRMVKEKRDSAC